MNISATLTRKMKGLEPKVRGGGLFLLVEEMDLRTAPRVDIDDLKSIVKDIVEIQRRTDLKFEALAESQRRTDLKFEALAEAPKGAERRIGRLEKVVGEIAEAQRDTELELRGLGISIRELKKNRLAGLAMTVGYGLEDKIMPYMKDFGRKCFGIDVSKVDRRNIVFTDGNYDEVNIFAEGTKNGQPAYIVGESKAQPGKKDLDRFEDMLNRLKDMFSGEFHPFFVGYQYSPDVEAYAQSKYPHIRICKSYEFELNYVRS